MDRIADPEPPQAPPYHEFNLGSWYKENYWNIIQCLVSILAVLIVAWPAASATQKLRQQYEQYIYDSCLCSPPKTVLPLPEINAVPRGNPQLLLKSFASLHKYSDSYNCLNYSADAQDLLSIMNLTVVTLTGTKITNGTLQRHAFIAIAYEPQTGELIPAGTYQIEKLSR